MADNNLPMNEPSESDLALIVDFLNHKLDPERVAQVRQRLEDDPEFRALAAPMLLVWSVPKHLDRHPRPAGELEKHWDEFTKRAGFAHQRRKTRRRRWWMLAIVVAAIGVSALVMRKPIAAWYDDVTNYYAVRAETGPVALPDGTRIHMSQDATVRASRTLIRETQRVKLMRGSARFDIVPNDSGEMLPGMQPVMVETRGGTVFAGRGEFTVTVRGDTTIVDVHQQSPASRRFIGFVPVPTAVLVDVPGRATPMSLAEGSRARLVRGRQPERISP